MQRLYVITFYFHQKRRRLLSSCLYQGHARNVLYFLSDAQQHPSVPLHSVKKKHFRILSDSIKADIAHPGSDKTTSKVNILMT
jgi:hypothetical protein